VLNYAARLRAGRAVDISDNNRLYGSLAHRLFEEFFAAHPNWASATNAEVAAWLEVHLPALIAREGALLLEPGRGVDRQRVISILDEALASLLDHLRAANIATVRVEHEEQQPYLGFELGGSIDLLLTHADGREIVMDAKWGGEKYRGDELAANMHFQLASYAYLRKRARAANAWPYPAYFVITTGNVLAPDDKVFPAANVHAAAPGECIEHLWARAEATYHWRREQLDSGLVEVNALFTEPTLASAPPEDALPTIFEGPSNFDDFTQLTGWSPHA
jgi:hypothetical protein